MSSGICIMQTCTAMQLPTSRLGQNKRHCQFENAWIPRDAFTNKPLNILQFFFCTCAWSPHLRLMLFCSANWIPLTISGSSGTMANSVTPMKYCKNKKPWRSSAYHLQHAVSWKCSPGFNSYESYFAHLGDGITEKGFDVFGAQVGAAGHQHCGGDQHRESPPAGPVNYMVTWEKRHNFWAVCAFPISLTFQVLLFSDSTCIYICISHIVHAQRGCLSMQQAVIAADRHAVSPKTWTLSTHLLKAPGWWQQCRH